MNYHQSQQSPFSDLNSSLPSAAAPPAVKKPSGCLVVFLGFMLALSLVAGIFLINLRLTFFSPTFWKNWLAKNEAYELVGEVFLPNIFILAATSSGTAAEEADAWPDGEATADYFSPAVQREIIVLLQDSLSPYWLQQQSENALDSFFYWTHGREPNLRIVFDLRSLQGPFTEGFLNIAEIKFNELPVCAAVPDPKNYDIETADCRPAGLDFATLREEFLLSDSQSAGPGYFPEEYIIDEAVFLNMWRAEDRELEGINQDVSNIFANPPRFYQLLMVWLVFTWIFVGIFLGLLLWIYRRSWPAGGKVLGITVIIPSALLVIFSLLIYWGAGSAGMIGSSLSTWSGNPDTAGLALTDSVISDFALPLLAGFIKASVRNILYVAAAFMAAAIVLLIISKVGSNSRSGSYKGDQLSPK